VVRLGVSEEGRVDEADLAEALAGGAPALVSLMWVNNETGMVLPVAEVAARARAAGAAVHTDAAQALGKVPVDLRAAQVDLLSATGHKIHGPKGTGLLFVRDGTAVAPLLHGGGQERGLRPGTEDVAGAVGLATAVRLAVAELDAEAARLGALRDRLERALLARVEGLRVNAGRAARAPHILSVGIEGAGNAAALVAALDLEGVAVSSGSACVSGASEVSHVLRALYGPGERRAALRFSLGRGTTAEDVDRAAAAVAAVVGRMRAAA
ncbi:MAG TPA: aminotransferase class V-fold PLP-dependent enzyme, partial [Longimicrobiales bacterium]|nr:aminotransferase class V-fold PLP-dependent enzyme [Longimicrobiales bacterium]